MSRLEYEPQIGYPANVGRFRPEQIARQSTWTKVPEGQRVTTSIHLIHVVPSNRSTEAFVNPLDPGESWYNDIGGESDWGRTVPAGKMVY